MTASLFRLLGRIAPGLHDLLHYRFADLPKDLAAGLAVAAVALPVGVAYAQLAGFHPAAGLYSSILPLLAYFLFGTSRHRSGCGHLRADCPYRNAHGRR